MVTPIQSADLVHMGLTGANDPDVPLHWLEIYVPTITKMNTLKVGFLLTALTALLVGIGQLLGGSTGMIIALGFAVVMNLGSFWVSDKLVIKMTRARPLGPGEFPWLRPMVADLAQRAGIPEPRLYLVPDRSPNAFATGRSPKHGVVAVNQGLLEMLDYKEVEGVVAHEIAHIKHRDTLTMAVVATVAGAVMTIANILQFAAIFGNSEDGPNPLVAIGIAMVAPIAAMMVQMGISRAREYEADATAAKLVGSGVGLQNALLKLERGTAMIPGRMPPQAAHMCIANPFGGASGLIRLFSTHPPIAERVGKLKALESTLR